MIRITGVVPAGAIVMLQTESGLPWHVKVELPTGAPACPSTNCCPARA